MHQLSDFAHGAPAYSWSSPPQDEKVTAQEPSCCSFLGQRGFKKVVPPVVKGLYPLVHIQKTMEHHNFYSNG